MVNASAKLILETTDLANYQEMKTFAREHIRRAGQALGAEHNISIQLRFHCACLDLCWEAPRDAVAESALVVREDLPRVRRLYGEGQVYHDFGNMLKQLEQILEENWSEADALNARRRLAAEKRAREGS